MGTTVALWRRVEYVLEVGRFATFAGRALARIPGVLSNRFRLRDAAHALDDVGTQALGIALLTGGTVGTLIGLHTTGTLEDLGLTHLFGEMVGLSMVREIGPVLVSVLAAARFSSGLASEIAMMQVTRQIDAMRVLRRDPMSVLVATRIIAALVAFPILVALGDVAGIAGAMIIATTTLDQTPLLFLNHVLFRVTLWDFIPHTVLKPAIFGMLVSSIAAWQGFRATGGPRQVGVAAVRAVVSSTVAIIVADFVLSVIIHAIAPLP